MNYAKINYEANCLISQTYGSTVIPEKGKVTVTVDGIQYVVSFCKKEDGWIIVGCEKL